jgi:hypothetical protein
VEEDIQKDIKEADEMLSKYEKLAPSDFSGAVKYLKEAFDILNACLEDNPASPFSKIIENKKMTYARDMLSRLPEDMGYSEWLPCLVFILTNKEEIDKVKEKNPEMVSIYRRFIDMWRKELLKSVEQEE